MASLPFLLFVKPPDSDWRWVVAIGFFLGIAQFGLLFTGMALGMPPGLSSTMMQTQPFFTMLFAIPVLHERPRWQNLAGLALAFVGVLVIAGHLDGVPLIPFLLVIAAAACWAASNVCTRRAKASNAMELIVWASAVAPLPMLALSWAVEGERADRNRRRPRDLDGLGLGRLRSPSSRPISPMGCGAICSNAIRPRPWRPIPCWCRSGASPWPRSIFDEPLNTAKWIGVGLVVAGVAANSWPSRKAQTVNTT